MEDIQFFQRHTGKWGFSALSEQEISDAMDRKDNQFSLVSNVKAFICRSVI